MRILIPILFLLSFPMAAQTIKPYKQNGQYKVDLNFPIDKYPLTGIIVDSSNFWKPTIPIPPDPIPTDDTTRIDGQKALFVGSWTTGQTLAPGWYKKTIAYSSVSNNTAALSFQGTRVELWAELKSGHGNGTVTIRNTVGTAIFSQAVNFSASTQQLPAMVYGKDLPQGQYTIELKVITGNNMLDFFVVRDYKEVTVPIPPPVGNIINVTPGTNTIGSAVRMAAQGWTVVPANGNYNEADFDVPVGVSIQGQSKSVVINGTTPARYPAQDAESYGVIKVKSSYKVNGNQKISNLTLRGNKVSMGGIISKYRDNVAIDNIHLEGFNFYAIWTSENNNSKITNITTKDCSWSSSGFSSGEICFVEIDNFIFENIEVSSTTTTGGYGFKALWGQYGSPTKYRSVYNGTFRNLKTRMNHLSAWDNYKSNNLGFEMQSVNIMGNVLIENSDFQNQVSLHSQTCSPGSVTIRNCTGDLMNDRYVIEYIQCRLTVERCNFKNSSLFFFNGQPNIKVTDGNIRDNTWDQGTAPTQSWGGVVLIGSSGASNVIVRNNIIRKKSNNPLLRYQQPPNTGVTFLESENTITNF